MDSRSRVCIAIIVTSVTGILCIPQWPQNIQTPNSANRFGSMQSDSAVCSWCRWMGLWTCVQNYCTYGSGFIPSISPGGEASYPAGQYAYGPVPFVYPYGPGSGFFPFGPNCALCRQLGDTHCMFKYCASGRGSLPPIFPRGTASYPALPAGPSAGGLVPSVYQSGPGAGFVPFGPNCALCQQLGDTHCMFKYCATGRRGFPPIFPEAGFPVNIPSVKRHPRKKIHGVQNVISLSMSKNQWKSAF